MKRGRSLYAVPWRAMRWGLLTIVLLASNANAAEWPYFVTYSHQMEEPGNLEIATRNVTGRPGGGNRFTGTAVELEYGVKGWWTSELYLDWQATRKESSFYTGYRWENRFRLLSREHWINPVLYLEYEKISGADRALLEIVGHDGQEDLAASKAVGRLEHKREMEVKLIAGSNFRGWNVSENFIAEKNLAHAPFEFGYAVAASRPLAMAASVDRCNFCLENIHVGAELYGGLGNHEAFGFGGTSQYFAPSVSLQLASGTTFKVSPGFGLTASSAPFLLRFGVSYEFAQFGRAASRFFR